MSKRLLTDWLDSFMQYTAPMECCDIYCKWSGIATLSAVLERKCWLAHGADLDFFPNFFIALVGRPGNRKTEALRVGARLLKELDIEPGMDSTTGAGLFREMKERYDDNLAQSDGKYSHASYSVFAEELSTFLRPAKIDVKWYETLTKLYDCGDYRHRTLTDGKIEIPNTYLTLLGGITPDGVNKAIPHTAIGEGLTGRIIFIWSDTRGVDPDPDRYNLAPRRQLREDLKHDLRLIKNMSGNFAKTGPFKEVYSPWYEANAKALVVPGKDFHGYNSRRGAHILKLAMIFCASRKDNHKQLIAEDFDRALRELRIAEVDMPRALSYVAKDDLARIQQDIVDILEMYTDLSIPQIYQRVKGAVSFNDLKNRVMPALIGSTECVFREVKKHRLYRINPDFKPLTFDKKEGD